MNSSWMGNNNNSNVGKYHGKVEKYNNDNIINKKEKDNIINQNQNIINNNTTNNNNNNNSIYQTFKDIPELDNIRKIKENELTHHEILKSKINNNNILFENELLNINKKEIKNTIIDLKDNDINIANITRYINLKKHLKNLTNNEDKGEIGYRLKAKFIKSIKSNWINKPKYEFLFKPFEIFDEKKNINEEYRTFTEEELMVYVRNECRMKIY